MGHLDIEVILEGKVLGAYQDNLDQEEYLGKREERVIYNTLLFSIFYFNIIVYCR